VTREEAAREARAAREALVSGLRAMARGEATREDVEPLAIAYQEAMRQWARVSGARFRVPSVATLLRALG